MITEYITYIQKYKDLNNSYSEEVDMWQFHGDGSGDFETIEDNTTLECIERYIEWCNQQLELAKEYAIILKERGELK